MVVCYGDISFREPFDVLLSDCFRELPSIVAICEAVVVSKLDERAGPTRLDLANLIDNTRDGLVNVPRAQQNRACAKLTLKWTPAAGLHRKAVVFDWIEQVVARC